MPHPFPRRTLLGAAAAAAGLSLLDPAILGGRRPAFAADGKTGPTYYTPEKVAAARTNVETYDWAAAIRDDAVTRAEPYLDLSDDELWALVPAQTIPRSLGVLLRYQARILGSPGPEGAEINDHGNYPWQIDPIAEPWKIKSPVTGEVYPSNDFASYYAAGLDAHGEFDPNLAKANGSQFLVNELYPERGERWGVDDGSGWTDDDGNIWTFIAYYAHWGLWNRLDADTYGFLLQGVLALQDAYLYTGQPQYAHKGLVLLDRIADVWPAMDVTAHLWDDGFDNGDPGVHTAQGKIVNDIWETSIARTLTTAYDAFWPAIDQDDELLEFVATKAEQHQIDTAKTTAADLRKHFEDHILRQVLPGVQTSQIRGNTGMHQAALALAAVVLDTEGDSDEILDFCFQPGSLVQVKDADAPYGRRYEVTGGDLSRLLVDTVDRDGHGNESAPGYNAGWQTPLLPVAEVLAGYERYPEYDLNENVRFQTMFSSQPPLMMLDHYTPSIGDSGKTGAPGVVMSLTTATAGFSATGDPLLAQIAHLLVEGDLSQIRGSVFDPDPEAIRDQIAAVVAKEGPLDPGTTHLTGYGFSGLRHGTGANARAVWLYYGRSSGHGHLDTLNLGAYGAGMDLAPDLGYPEVTGTDPERLNWTAATVSHNTVVVDESSQKSQWVARPELLGDAELVSLAEVEAAHCYDQTSRYRRTTALVRIDDRSSYAVDLFRVVGGGSHVFSFHGGPGTVTTDGLSLTAQDEGSYAGPEVPFQDPSYNTSARAGFNYLNAVERDPDPNPTWSVDWQVADQWEVHDQDPEAHLRLTMLTAVDDVALADGIPPRNKPGNPASLRYVLARRTGEELRSTFTSLLEPWVGAPRVEAVSLAAVTGGDPDPDDITAVRVELDTGEVDLVISSLDDVTEFVVDGRVRFRGRFGVIRTSAETVVSRWLHGATLLDLVGTPRALQPASVTGTVVSFTTDLATQNELVIHHDALPAGFGRTLERLPGSWIHVANDGVRNASYQILAAESAGRELLRLDLGPQSPVRTLADPEDVSAGYLFDIGVDAAVTIPLSWQD